MSSIEVKENSFSNHASPIFENDVERKRQTHNGIVQPLLTDLYQITMSYAYWKSGKVKDEAVFDLFFRKNPFQGEFTIFAGLEECLRFLENFHYSDSDIEYLKQTLPPAIEPEFFVFLKKLTAKDVTLYAIEEGSVVFPRVPLIRVEGPLIIVQLLETTLLTLVNYASLMATNAARYRMAAGKTLRLLEFGLRRAQGPDGGLSASKYSYIGGFDGTSNVLAGKLFDIPVKGTHAHAYITSFTGIVEVRNMNLAHKHTGELHNLLELSSDWRDRLAPLFKVVGTEASDGELAALISFAIAFPDGFMALVDTYDVKRYPRRMQCTHNDNENNNFPKASTAVNNTASSVAQATLPSITLSSSRDKNPQLNTSDTNDDTTHFSDRFCFIEDTVNNNGILTRDSCYCGGKNEHCDYSIRNYHTNHWSYRISRSGLLNFCSVSMALNNLGYRAVGIRIDSGDLAYLSNIARQYFTQISDTYDVPWFKDLMIMASNDINEETILSLNEQGHDIDCFGIGTHLVTCERQPALGCVYKMVEINSQPRIKLSQDVDKVTMPGRKDAYRLYGTNGYALIDLLQRSVEAPPQVGQRVLCRHPFEESKRAYVIPTKVEKLHKLYWKNGEIVGPLPTLAAVREKVASSLRTLRTDIKRNLNPTPFKVAVSDCLYNYLHDLWLENAPIGELS